MDYRERNASRFAFLRRTGTAAITPKISSCEILVLTLEPLTPIPKKKQCVICGKIFGKPLHIGTPQWAKQISCSIDCQRIRRHAKDTLKKYKALRYGVRRFNCSICGQHILGSKRDVKAHKFEQHSH